MVRADEKRLRQILINLLGNAVKFTQHGGVIFRLRYAREMATFEIEDSGPGISAEEIERIFEPFSRGDSAQATAAPGTGLGLTIAKMLTDLMGGELNVRSTPGTGTLFTVRLFLPHLHSAQAAKELPRISQTGYLGPRRRILIVDNEQVDRELLASVLSPLGFELDQAASGMECLEVLPRFQPDVIFMDLAMPGIDGWETIRRIRAQNLSSAHIAIISANAFDRGLDNDVSIANEDFILKPVKVEELAWLQLGRAVATRLDRLAVANDKETVQQPTSTAAHAIPPRARLEALIKQISLGYVRGIQGTLDEIAEEDPAHAGFVGHMRDLLGRFQLDAMSESVRKSLDVQA